MSQEKRKELFAGLVKRYLQYKQEGKLDLTSEETIRTWLNEMLEIFGWDVQDTSQVLQEKVLSEEEKAKLAEIGSTNTRPDYTFKLAKHKLTFLDAKDISVDLAKDVKAAYQIKSYGWSILAPCAFISNFEQLAIYDCRYVPKADQPADFGRIFLTVDEYVGNFELLDDHLYKANVYSGKLAELYSKEEIEGVEKLTPDLAFANFLSGFRVQLATNILHNNEGLIANDSAQLGYVVQVIINRILFIRVCEARILEEKGLLLSFKANGFWDSFKQSSYIDFYAHYDGPLFERIESIHSLIIDDAVFIPLLDYLYYPSPYKFDVIPTKLLSDIYEIFLSKRLFITNGNKVEVQWKPEYLKSKGAVSTPQFLVREIIKRTLPKNLIADEGIAKLISFKTIDIACGSGGFLIELMDYLEELMIDVHSVRQEEAYRHLFVQTDSELILNLDGKKTIIENCVYGVDIDPEAVEVAKMALALKVVDNEEQEQYSTQIGLFGEQILNGVGGNIQCGNSLVDSTVYDRYPEILQDEQGLFSTKAFDWDATDSFLRVFESKGGFDFVVGNPPYVEIKHFKNELPYMHRFVNETFVTGSNGKLDLAVPFVERGMAILNGDGKLGYIIQKRFFKTEYGSSVRHFITDANYLCSITDFECTSLFQKRLTYVAILVLQKSGRDTFFYHMVNEDRESVPAYLRGLPVPEIDPNRYNLLQASAFGEEEWSFDCFEIRNRLQNRFGTLGGYVKLKGGPQALKNAAYHIKVEKIEKGVIFGYSQWAENIQVELDACRPLFCNEQFYPLRPDTTSTYVIFPYDIDDAGKREIPYDEYCNRFPLAGAYLDSQREAIHEAVQTMPERFPKKYDGNYWHLYTRPNNLDHTYPKVLIPMTAKDTFASITMSDRLYADNANMWFVQIPDVNESILYAVAGVINSTLFSVLARSIANPQDAGYFKFNKQFIEPVPFPREAFLVNGGLRDQIATLTRDIETRQIQYASSGAGRRTVLEPVLRQLWQQLDYLIYDLYDLAQEDRIFFEGRGRNVDRVAFSTQWM